MRFSVQTIYSDILFSTLKFETIEETAYSPSRSTHDVVGVCVGMT